GIREFHVTGVQTCALPIYRQAWTQERFESGEAIDYPALSLAKTVNHEPSDFFKFDRSYLRLKNIEMAYTLPRKFSRKIKSTNAKDRKSVVKGKKILHKWCC